MTRMPIGRDDGYYVFEAGACRFVPFRPPPDVELTPAPKPRPPFARCAMKLRGRIVALFSRRDPLESLVRMKGHGL